MGRGVVLEQLDTSCIPSQALHTARRANEMLSNRGHEDEPRPRLSGQRCLLSAGKQLRSRMTFGPAVIDVVP